MLLEFTCSNYKSIMNKVTFSFLASNDDTYEDELKQFSSHRILRSAAIYGPNGSGKSNFLDSIQFMTALVISSIHNQPGDLIQQHPHKLKGENTPTVFTIQFVRNDIRYSYGFSIKNKIIDEEYLYYFPKGRQVKIFERKGTEIVPGDKYKSVYTLSLDALKENRLFLSCAANYTNIEEIKQVFMFFRKDIVIYDSDHNNWIEYSVQSIQESEFNKKLFIKILNSFGTNVKDIKTTIEKVKIADLPGDMPDPLKALFAGTNEVNHFNIKLIYDKFETDLMMEESNGVRKLFEVICPILDILNHGKILICDEIETSLHEAIVCEIVSLFKYTKKDEFAQLLFSTHDTSLLDSKLFRRDQIWFTELDENRSTDLYSLSEIRNVRKIENLKNGYILGKYGAIPCRSENIYSLFDSDFKR